MPSTGGSELRLSPARRAGAVLALTGLAALTGCGGGSPAAAPACSAGLPGRAQFTVDPEQARNASTIAVTGKRLGLPDHAITVALVTALQESHLHNLHYGDRDSLGLFQQRPSQGWGTPERILVPRLSAAAFYRRLSQVPGWAGLAVGDAAQAVQHSAAPDAYAPWESQARVFAQVLTGEVPAGLTCSGSTPVGPLLAADLRAGEVAELGPGPLDPDVATTGPDAGRIRWMQAAWAVAHASTYRVRTVVCAGRRWTAGSGRWSAAAGAGAALRIS